MEDIIIKRDGNFGFDVWQGNKHSNQCQRTDLAFNG